MKRVLLTCQGSIQAMAAIAALGEQERRFPAPRELHLVVHGLYAPEGRGEAFAEVVRDLSASLVPLATVTHFSDEEMASWGRRAETTNVGRLRALLRERLGLETADEIYASRNWLLGNELLLEAYPEAERICYGDGIGFYFTARYGSPAGDREARYFGDPIRALGEGRQLFRRARRQMGAWLGWRTQLVPRPFARGYFLVPPIFGDAPDMPWEPVPADSFRRLLARAARAARLPELSVGQHFVLTSNLSEARRLSMDAEVEAYERYLLERVAAGTRLVLKPHPRERREKTLALADRLRRRHEVDVWDDPRLACFPVEAWLARGESAQSVDVTTFGTAVLSLSRLFGRKPALGFGEAIVRRYFPPDHAEWRLRFERDLSTAIEPSR